MLWFGIPVLSRRPIEKINPNTYLWRGRPSDLSFDIVSTCRPKQRPFMRFEGSKNRPSSSFVTYRWLSALTSMCVSACVSVCAWQGTLFLPYLSLLRSTTCVRVVDDKSSTGALLHWLTSSGTHKLLPLPFLMTVQTQQFKDRFYTNYVVTFVFDSRPCYHRQSSKGRNILLPLQTRSFSLYTYFRGPLFPSIVKVHNILFLVSVTNLKLSRPRGDNLYLKKKKKPFFHKFPFNTYLPSY